MTFVPGDFIIDKHQLGTQPKLVVSTTDDPAFVIAFDGVDRHFKRCLCRIYKLVSPATDASRQEAIDHTLTEAYERAAPLFIW